MYLKREFPNLPFILLGHSMGSLVVRTYLKKYSQEVDAVILSGSPCPRISAMAHIYPRRLKYSIGAA